MPKENYYVSYVLGQDKLKKKKGNFKNIKKFIKENKLIVTTFIIFILCLNLNVILIFNFLKILEKM